MLPGEIQNRIGNFPRGKSTVERHSIDPLSKRLLRIRRLAYMKAEHGRIGNARANAVHTNAKWSQIQCETLGEHGHGSLRSHVGGSVLLGDETGHRTDIDDGGMR